MKYNMEELERFINEIKRFGHCLAIIGSIQDTCKLIRRGYSSHPLSLLLPLLILNIIPPVIANCCYKRFVLSGEVMKNLIIGMALGIFFKSYKKVLFFIDSLAILAKITSAYDIAVSPERTNDIVAWLFVKSLMQVIIRKALFRKKITLRKTEFFDYFFNFIALLYVRTNGKPFYVMIIFTLAIPIVIKFFDYIFSKFDTVDPEFENAFKKIELPLESSMENEHNQKALTPGGGRKKKIERSVQVKGNNK